jgi:hypothetical protein
MSLAAPVAAPTALAMPLLEARNVSRSFQVSAGVFRA